MFQYAYIGVASGGALLIFDGAFSTSSGSSPVTSATRTVTGLGTLQFNNLFGVALAVEYSKNGGAWTTITNGLTLAMSNGDTLAVRSTIPIPGNSTTFDITNNDTSALIEAVTLEHP